jgi:hypothetical protein
VADRPLRPATDRRLGGPLPRQQANRTQATPKAHRCFGPRPICGISPSFPGLSPTFGHVPTRFSPVRHSPCGACDLHVLSIPPAFALSQDQTLKFIFIARDRAGARSRRRLSTRLRSPLSMRSAFPSSSHAPTPPLRGTARAGKSESARLLPKDRYGCQRSRGPSRGTEPTRRRPHVSAGQRASARRHRDQDRSRTALNPRIPPPTRPKAPPTDRLGRSNRSATGNPIWHPVAPVSRPVGASPKGTASRRTIKLVPSGPDFKTR